MEEKLSLQQIFPHGGVRKRFLSNFYLFAVLLLMVILEGALELSNSYSIYFILVSSTFTTQNSLDNECTCVHIEPVGWQRSKNLITDDITVIAGNVDPKEYIPLDPFFTRNAALLARTRDYNYNLLSLLDVLVNSGEIQIFEQNFDVFGINPFNPSTVISWKKNGLNK